MEGIDRNKILSTTKYGEATPVATLPVPRQWNERREYIYLNFKLGANCVHEKTILKTARYKGLRKHRDDTNPRTKKVNSHILPDGDPTADCDLPVEVTKLDQTEVYGFLL